MKSFKEIHKAFYTGKSPKVTKEHRKGNGTSDLIVSALWFIAAIVSGLIGSFIFTLPGIAGGIYFLVQGLTKRKHYKETQ